MRTPLLSVLVAAHAVLCPIAASADSGYWTDREICRAAVKTYFFLGIKPADAPDNGEFLGFRSASGNVHTCRVAGTRTQFRWLNASGETMHSNPTTFRLEGDTLTIRTDMKEERFPAE